MKTFAIAFCIVITSITLCAQGLVNFANTPSTLVSAQALEANGPYSVMSGPPGTYYFGLYLGSPGGNYTFSGIYATNTGVDGLFNGGTAAVPGWAPGTSTNYFVIGWSAFMGHDFNPMWFHGGSAGDSGLSAPASGIAGNGSSIPILNLFDGGGNTIVGGFQLRNTLVPEPTTVALGVVGAVLILYRNQKKRRRIP